jgi:DNA-binding transcriptional ArsR family regulator
LSAAAISASADVECPRWRDDGAIRGDQKEVLNHVTIQHPLPDDLVELIAQRFRVLSEPSRIKLLDRLRDGEASVLELTAAIGTTEQNVSKHLGVLNRAGIVRRRKHGNFSYYAIADEGVFALCEQVCGQLERELEDLRQIVSVG